MNTKNADGSFLEIKEIYAWIALDGTGEGIPAIQVNNGQVMPLIGADTARIESLEEVAQQTADMTGKPVTLVRFSVREELRTLTPRTNN